MKKSLNIELGCAGARLEMSTESQTMWAGTTTNEKRRENRNGIDVVDEREPNRD